MARRDGVREALESTDDRSGRALPVEIWDPGRRVRLECTSLPSSATAALSSVTEESGYRLMAFEYSSNNEVHVTVAPGSSPDVEARWTLKLRDGRLRALQLPTEDKASFAFDYDSRRGRLVISGLTTPLRTTRGDHEELVTAEVHHDLGVGALGALGCGVFVGGPEAGRGRGRQGTAPGWCGPAGRSWPSGFIAVHALVDVDQGGCGVGVVREADPPPLRGEDGHRAPYRCRRRTPRCSRRTGRGPSPTTPSSGRRPGRLGRRR